MSSLVVNPGAVNQLQQTGNVFKGQAEHAAFRVAFLQPDLVHICFARTPNWNEHSYSVVTRAPQSVEILSGSTAHNYLLETSAITVSISKQTAALTFLDKESRVLNQDEPGLAITWIGEQVTAYKSLMEGERFIGLGEKTGPLDRRGRGYQHWNTDAFAYGPDADPIYCSIPFYIGVHAEGVYGIFFDNTHKTHFNFGASNNRFASFSADAGEMNYYFIGGKSVAEIIEKYTWLTGRMELPPLWSLGYQQCRYSYYPDAEVRTLARTFRDKQIPADTIVLDIHYMDGYKIFSWHDQHFKNPQTLMDELKALGFNVVVMCDPGIKIESGYAPYGEGLDQDLFLTYPDGKNYEGQVWPGWCHFPDFTKPETRAWWKKWLKTYSDMGITGFWNDMNEIATWGQTLPENIIFNFEGTPATTRKGRNIYGMMMARATYEGAKANLSGKRPFNLTRSGFAGIQRYAAVWTGDNVSYDEHMMLGVRLVNSMGLSGIAFAGYDIGGFVGEASSKLFARWISIGALSPFCRSHTMINSRDSEPWAFGEETEQIARNYIRLRYQLMPYLYSSFYEASQTGMPVQRSLAVYYPNEPRVYQYQHQYMFGPAILVAPVESEKSITKVFLPEGTWYYLFTGNRFEGNAEIFVECPPHKLPIFIKGGAIIPMHSPSENTKAVHTLLALHVYKGKQENAYEFYTDDGESYAYQTNGYAKRNIRYQPATNTITVAAQEGLFEPSYTSIKFVLHGFDNKKAKVQGVEQPLATETLEFFLPLEKFDPLGAPDTMGSETVLTTEVAFDKGKITLELLP